MATMTRADIIKGALEHLKVLKAGDTPSGEDTDRVGNVVDSVHDRLRQQGRAPWALTAVPGYAQDPLIEIVSVQCSSYFGQAKDVELKKEAQRELDDQERVRDLGTHVVFPEF